MCGIAGFFGRRDEARVRLMLAGLAHRGPDDTHLVMGDRFTLGTVRLAVIDLETGRQPMAGEDGRLVACQNGELYDYVELRRDLEGRGHRFRTRGDTEVIVHGFEEWGQGLADRLLGMFAIAIWDGRRGEGHLWRDRIGKKPLYYAPLDGGLLFASEMKALLPWVERRVDPASIDLFLGLKHVPAPRTAWSSIRALEPGHRLRFVPGEAPVVERYWRVDWSRPLALEGEALGDEIVRRLGKAVDRRLRADVPIGFFLSGGLDSSLVAALAAERAAAPIRTYTLTHAACAPAGKALDRRYAGQIAERYRTAHREASVAAPDLARSLPAIVRCFDEPFAGVVSTFFLAARVAEDVKVAVSGDGADELFGSYRSHRLAALLAHGIAPPPDALRLRWGIDPALFHWARGQPEWRWRSRLVVFTDEEKQALYSSSFKRRLADTGGSSVEAYFRERYERTTAPDPLGRTLEVELGSQLPDQVLCFVDRLSMAHSLEIRSPFLDEDLLELLFALPPGERIAPDGACKVALKRAARHFLPPEIVERPKEGFLPPVGRWLAEARPWVEGVLSSEAVARAEVFEPAAIAKLLGRFFGGDQAESAKVFALVCHQLWHDLYVAGARVAA